jgi:hypothetical protein
MGRGERRRMSISNVDRMREALVRDEMNYFQTLNRGELFEALKELLIEKYDNMPERHIIEDYESLA